MKNKTFLLSGTEIPYNVVREFFLSNVNSIDSKKDIWKILIYAKVMIGIKDMDSFLLGSLTKYANPKFCDKRYTQFVVKKKSGDDRVINAPVIQLKYILKALNFVLQIVGSPAKEANGFVVSKSIVDNAQLHTNNNYVFNIDLKDFFHSFDRNRVKLWFMRAPFNLSGDKEPLAFMLASLCTHPFEVNGETKIVLPQGSPTSPTLTNLLCKPLDIQLKGLANRFGATYSRYADDITFSSQHNIYSKKEFLNELNRIITHHNLKINPKKTRLQKRGYKQEVTGLIVNEKVNIKRKYVKQLRNWLYLWEKYGYLKANKHFLKDYQSDKGHIKKGTPNIIDVISGKLDYLKMVKGADNGTYKGLKKRFDSLVSSIDSLNGILEIWEEEGVEKAMDLYYNKHYKNSFIVMTLRAK